MCRATHSRHSTDARSWELNTAPLSTVYQGLLGITSLSSLTIRCQRRRTPRPTTIIPPLPNLLTLVFYDIDPLCYPDDISLLLAGSKKLENLQLHWNPRMRENGEESVNLMTLFGRCVATRYTMRIKRLAMYNLYTRFHGDDLNVIIDPAAQTEVTIINSMGSSDPMTVFLDDSWRVQHKPPVPPNLKMLRTDNMDKESAVMFGRFHGLERLYFVSNKHGKSMSKPDSSAATPTTPSTATPGMSNGATTGTSTPIVTEYQCRNMAGDYLAVLQSNHRTLRHLLLPDIWQLSDDALFKLCQACPNLEQLGFSCVVPHLESLRQIVSMTPKLWAIRMLIRPGAELAEKIHSMEPEMHAFAIATEFWRPEYKNVKYIGMGAELVFKLGGVYIPPKGRETISPGHENSMNAKRAGPIRKIQLVSRESVKHIEIWGLDSTEFVPKFP